MNFDWWISKKIICVNFYLLFPSLVFWNFIGRNDERCWMYFWEVSFWGYVGSLAKRAYFSLNNSHSLPPIIGLKRERLISKFWDWIYYFVSLWIDFAVCGNVNHYIKHDKTTKKVSWKILLKFHLIQLNRSWFVMWFRSIPHLQSLFCGPHTPKLSTLISGFLFFSFKIESWILFGLDFSLLSSILNPPSPPPQTLPISALQWTYPDVETLLL